MRLSRAFNLSLPLALDVLYPHLQNATSWAKANEPSPNLLDNPPTTTRNMVSSDKKDACVTPLPRLSRFTIIASFLAPTKPPKPDLRIIGRGLDEEMKKRKRRISGQPSKTKGGLTKVTQCLLGPTLFTLDRMLGIPGALLEGNNVDFRIHAHVRFRVQYTGRVDGYGGITRSYVRSDNGADWSLTGTSAVDRSDGSPKVRRHRRGDMLARELLSRGDISWEATLKPAAESIKSSTQSTWI